IYQRLLARPARMAMVGSAVSKRGFQSASHLARKATTAVSVDSPFGHDFLVSLAWESHHAASVFGSGGDDCWGWGCWTSAWVARRCAVTGQDNAPFPASGRAFRLPWCPL